MIPGREPLTKENIFKKISSYDIFRFYCPYFREVGKSFKSDLPGRTDVNPSARIEFIGGDLMYSDFGYKTGLRAIDYVMEKYGLGFLDALIKINDDFKLEFGIGISRSGIVRANGTPILKPSPEFTEKPRTIIKKKQRPFTSKDLKYWNSFYWTEDMLVKAKTQSISNYWINGTRWVVKPDELAFSYEYYWHGGVMQRKLYFPEKTEFRWFSNVDPTIVQLVDVAPKKGDILIITSSKKDAGIFWRMTLDNMFPDVIIHGVAPNTENTFVPEKWFYKMKKRWKHIVLWYNNDWDREDNPGVINAKKYSEMYDIPYYHNPDNEPKDPSDFCKKYSIHEFSNFFHSKLNQIFNVKN